MEGPAALCLVGRTSRCCTEFASRARRSHHMTAPTAEPARPPSRPGLMLALATVGFAVNFWAWALLSPLGPRFKELLALSSFEQALLVAVPVVVGSLGRIPIG